MTSMYLHVLSRLLRHTESVLKSAYLAFALTVLVWLQPSVQAWPWSWLVAMSFVVIAVHHYLSIRVRFDADLLEHVAGMIDSGTGERSAMQMLDDSLVGLGLMDPSKEGRDWGLRLAGCRRLFRLQVVLLVLQYVMMVLVVLVTTHR